MLKKQLMSLLGLTLIMLSGCSSTAEPQKKVAPQLNNQAGVVITSDELAELKASVKQWQQAKAGVERLLVIEQDLKLLIKQLTSVAQEQQSAAAAQKSESKIAKNSSLNPEPIAPPAPIQPTKAQPTKAQPIKVQPLFALQVASVTDQTRLPQSFAKIKATAPTIFAGKVAANVESVNVNGTTFYRLKLGAYIKQENAAKDCNKLMQYQVMCIVSHYTEQPLKM
ncbi:SPOR domain-containing protein [Pseudoalteromonas aliena]|nr:SPOR domain-containing protein [Pseudoalteromonas aliena]